VLYLIAWFSLYPGLLHIGAAASLTDAFGFVGSCIAQTLMCLERYEAWPLWFVVDGVYAYQFWHGKSYLTAILYLIFVLLAIGGWKRWLRIANT
jgi:nicotinamide mononucleotide transporter